MAPVEMMLNVTLWMRYNEYSETPQDDHSRLIRMCDFFKVSDRFQIFEAAYICQMQVNSMQVNSLDVMNV